MINKDYQESFPTAGSGAGRATASQQSRARGNRSNKGVRAYRRKKYEPDERQLEFDFGIAQQENTGGGK